MSICYVRVCKLILDRLFEIKRIKTKGKDTKGPFCQIVTQETRLCRLIMCAQVYILYKTLFVDLACCFSVQVTATEVGKNVAHKLTISPHPSLHIMGSKCAIFTLLIPIYADRKLPLVRNESLTNRTKNKSVIYIYYCILAWVNDFTPKKLKPKLCAQVLLQWGMAEMKNSYSTHICFLWPGDPGSKESSEDSLLESIVLIQKL